MCLRHPGGLEPSQKKKKENQNNQQNIAKEKKETNKKKEWWRKGRIHNSFKFRIQTWAVELNENPTRL
jgi:hypothetical protein